MAAVIAECTEAIRLNPEDADAYFRRGVARDTLNDLSNALTDLLEATRLLPIGKHFYQLGLTQLKLKDYAGAITSFDTTTRLEPFHSDAFGQRGNAYLLMENQEMALRDFQEACKLSPDDLVGTAGLKKLGFRVALSPAKSLSPRRPIVSPVSGKPNPRAVTITREIDFGIPPSPTHRDDRMCQECHIRRKDCYLAPCRHTGWCRECVAKSLTHCPIKCMKVENWSEQLGLTSTLGSWSRHRFVRLSSVFGVIRATRSIADYSKQIKYRPDDPSIVMLPTRIDQVRPRTRICSFHDFSKSYEVPILVRRSPFIEILHTSAKATSAADSFHSDAAESAVDQLESPATVFRHLIPNLPRVTQDRIYDEQLKGFYGSGVGQRTDFLIRAEAVFVKDTRERQDHEKQTHGRAYNAVAIGHFLSLADILEASDNAVLAAPKRPIPHFGSMRETTTSADLRIPLRVVFSWFRQVVDTLVVLNLPHRNICPFSLFLRKNKNPNIGADVHHLMVGCPGIGFESFSDILLNQSDNEWSRFVAPEITDLMDFSDDENSGVRGGNSESEGEIGLSDSSIWHSSHRQSTVRRMNGPFFSEKSDVFSVGTTFLEILSYFEQQTDDLDLALFGRMEEILQKCVVEDPMHRPTFLSLLEMIGGQLTDTERLFLGVPETVAASSSQRPTDAEDDQRETDDVMIRSVDALLDRSERLENLERVEHLGVTRGPVSTSLAKAIVIGDSGVGKSSIIGRFRDNRFSSAYKSTIGVDFSLKNVRVTPEKNVRLQIWDTAGQERFRTMTSSFYRGAQIAIIVFDITNRISFRNCSEWIHELQRNSLSESESESGITMVLVGNKTDLSGQREVSVEEAEEFCRSYSGLIYYECSAKTGISVEEIFKEAAQRIQQRTDIMRDDRIPLIRLNEEMGLRKSSYEMRQSGGCCVVSPMYSMWSGIGSLFVRDTTPEPVPAPKQQTDIRTDDDGDDDENTVFRPQIVLYDRRMDITQLGKIRKDAFQIRKLIGQGGQSSVFLCKERTLRHTYVMKRYKTTVTKSEYENEINSLKKLLGKKNILKFIENFEFFDEFGERQRFLIVEHCEKGDFKRILRRKQNLRKKKQKVFNFSDFLENIKKILNGVRSIHECSLVHCDLKPSNIFVYSTNDLCIGDFGFCTPILDELQQTDIQTTGVKGGTCGYMSPEQRNGGNFGKFSTDIWSLGICMIEMVLFEINIRKIRKDVSNYVSEEISPILSEYGIGGMTLLSLINECFDLNPENRPNISEMIQKIDEIQKMSENE